MQTPLPATPANRTFWILFLLLGVVWGSTYAFVGIAVRTLGPFTLVAARLAIGAAVLAVVFVAARAPLPRGLRTWADLAILAALNLVIPFSLASWGQETVDSGLASVLNSTIPFFALLLAAGLLADERITWRAVTGLVLGFGGVVVLVAPSLQAGTRGTLPGEITLLASSVSYGAATVFVRRRLGGVHPITLAFVQAVFGSVATAALALAFERPSATAIQADTIVAVAWLGVAGSGLAYVAFFRMIEQWGATRSSTIAYALPVVGVFLGWAMLGETIDARVLAGTGLVIVGIARTNGVGIGRSGRSLRPARGTGRTVEPERAEA